MRYLVLKYLANTINGIIISDKDNPKSYCHIFPFKIHLVMKTALFKLLNLTIIPRYTTNYNIKSPLFK
ncbi:hypothetical protein Kyoto55A_12440 [Helicobacter pylori]